MVEAHSRSQSTAAGNVKLANQRGQAVKKRLVKKGVPEERIRVLAHGAARRLKFSESREVKLRTVDAAQHPARLTHVREKGSTDVDVRIEVDFEGSLNVEQVEVGAWSKGLEIRVDRVEARRQTSKSKAADVSWVRLGPDPKRPPAASIQLKAKVGDPTKAQVKVEAGKLVVIVPR